MWKLFSLSDISRISLVSFPSTTDTIFVQQSWEFCNFPVLSWCWPLAVLTYLNVTSGIFPKSQEYSISVTKISTQTHFLENSLHMYNVQRRTDLIVGYVSIFKKLNQGIVRLIRVFNIVKAAVFLKIKKKLCKDGVTASSRLSSKKTKKKVEKITKTPTPTQRPHQPYGIETSDSRSVHKNLRRGALKMTTSGPAINY